MVQYFDEAFYLRRYEDVRTALEAGTAGFSSAAEHFATVGKLEGRDPNAFFDSSYYLAQNEDLSSAVGEGQAFASAYDHFIAHGIFEPRKTSSLFDARYYTNQASNIDVSVAVFQGQTTAFDHFFHAGRNEFRIATPNFDPNKYLQANSDLTSVISTGFISAYDHLVISGIPEERDLGNGIRIADLSIDTSLRSAIFVGDASEAIARIEAILPLLPSYERPDDFVVAAGTTLTTDFSAQPGIQFALPSEVTTAVTSTTSSYSAISYHYTGTSLTLSGTIPSTGGTIALETAPDAIITSSGTIKLRDDFDVTALNYSGINGGNITITGSAIAETYTGGTVTSNISAGSGNDTITASTAADTISGGVGDDSIVGNGGADTITGGTGNDTIITTDGADVIDAGDGNDSINAGVGTNSLTGGDGNDTIIAGAGADTILGGDGDDSITSGDGDNRIDGGTGNDTIIGGGAVDTITGGFGNDSLTGGNGADQFIFSVINGLDVITDFVTGADKLSVGSLITTSTVTNPTAVAVTSGVTAAGALTDERAYVISTGATSITGGAQTVADYSDLADVASYLAEGFTSTAASDGAVFIINNGTGTASVYAFNEDAADGIEAADLTLVATITGTVVAGDIL